MGSQTPTINPLDRYTLLEVIGTGSFGQVWRAIDRVKSREVAVKVVDLDEIGDEIQDIQQEVHMLRTCRSPNIVEYYGAYLAPGTARLHIAMELMAASVADLVSPDAGGTPLPEPAIAYVLREVLNALVYLHSEHRIHRDVKAANVLLSSNGMVKVSDFGVAAQLGSSVGLKRRTFVGSPLWMAPEVIEQSPDMGEGAQSGNQGEGGGGGGQPRSGDGYDEAADIWSLGITAIEMAVGEPPRSGVPSFRLLFLIVREPPPQLEGTFSSEFRDFVSECLQKSPSDRPSAIDLLMHPFMARAERPADLPQRIAQCVERKKSSQLQSHGPGKDVNSGDAGDIPAGPGQGWDFGTVRSAAVPGKNPAAAAAAAIPSSEAKKETKLPKETTQPAPGYNATVVSKAARPPHVEIPGANAGIEPPMLSASASSRPLADAAPLKLLVQPALRSAAGDNPRASLAAEAAASAFSQLEAAVPGSTQAALIQMMALLGTSGSPLLSDLRTSAQESLGTSSSNRKGMQGFVSVPATLGVAGGDDGESDVDLGPLGNFLLARWHDEEVGRQHAAAADF